MINHSFFKNKRVTVFGLGLNTGGVGTVEFLVRAGAKEIIVTDIKNKEDLGPSLEKLKNYKNVRAILGQHRPEDFSRVDLVIKNPVIPWTNEYVKLAEKHGVPVEMDSSIFFALCKAPIIGVTGTKGKTTTAELTAHLLATGGKKVVRVGIGQAGVLSRLAAITPESLVVFELSSWRLSALGRAKTSPGTAVLTNIYPDHLNYYKNMAAYVADKKNIFRYQKKSGTLVANLDNPTVVEMAQDAPGQVYWYTAGVDPEGSSAVWIEDEAIYARLAGSKKALVALSDLAPASLAFLPNVVAAVTTALAQNIAREHIVAGLRSFVGVPHRLERVAEKGGVTYYNDSAATIPEATLASLRSFSRPPVLIAGGTDKNLNFQELAQAILDATKSVVFLKGTATEKIVAALRVRLSDKEKSRVFPVFDNMNAAVAAARALAEAGDAVVLSPGATSFGMFHNEFDRGDQFRQVVQALD